MPARVYTADKAYKGRTIASIVRTNFGAKAVYVPAEDGQGGTVQIDGNVVAEIRSVSEWKAVKPESRATRWQNACNKLREAIDRATEVYEEYDASLEDEDTAEEFDTEDAQSRADEATSLWSDGISELEELQGEYQEWFDNLPDTLQYDSPVADKLQEVTGLYFDYVEFTYDEDPSYSAESYVDEYESVDLPLGWGRD